MQYKTRKEAIGILLQLQGEFEVNDWKYEGVRIWPLIKSELFLFLFKKDNVQNKKSRDSFIHSIIEKFKVINQLAWAVRFLSLLKINKSPFLFSGAENFRAQHEGRSMNRYFDPIMDYLTNEYEVSSLLLENKSSDDSNYYKSDRVVELQRLFSFFKQRSRLFLKYKKPEINSDLNKLLEVFCERTGYKQNLNLLRNLIVQRIEEVWVWKDLFEYFLKKVQPKYAFGLCYYNRPTCGLILAAKSLGVRTIDMQHGGQGKLHHCYSGFNLPEGGYEMLPDIFWCWDDASARNLDLELEYSESHITIAGGNPWHVFHSNEKLLDTDKIQILFSLQPYHDFLHPDLVKILRGTPHDVNWILRLHPRMDEQEFSILQEFVNENGLKDQVQISYAGSEPFQNALGKVDVHVSRNSASIIEASLLNKPSIILDQVGVETYYDYIEQGRAFGFIEGSSTEFYSLVKQIMGQTTDNTMIDFKQTIKQHFTTRKSKKES